MSSPKYKLAVVYDPYAVRIEKSFSLSCFPKYLVQAERVTCVVSDTP